MKNLTNSKVVKFPVSCFSMLGFLRDSRSCSEQGILSKFLKSFSIR